MFALALGALFLGDIVGPLPSMLFVVAVALLATRYVNSRFDFRRFFSAFTLPLMAFTAIHLLSSLVHGVDNLMVRLLQLGPAYLFGFLLIYQYSRDSLRGMLIATGVVGAVILAWVVAWHFSRGIFMPLKYFYETKTIFSFVPLAIFFAMKARGPFLRYGIVIALMILLTMSGERKAYLAMGLSAVFIFDLRRPANVFAGIGLVLGLIAMIRIDTTGYLAQQFGSLFALGEGRVENTVSNLTREWQLQYALRVWESSPIFGIGTNGYISLVQDNYRSTGTSEMVILNDVGIHGEGLRVLVENGIVGATALAVLVGASLYRIARRFLTPQDRDGAITAALLFIGLICYLGLEGFDTNAVVFYALLPNLWRLRVGSVDVLSADPRHSTSTLRGRGELPPVKTRQAGFIVP